MRKNRKLAPPPPRLKRVVLSAPPHYEPETAPLWATLGTAADGKMTVKLRHAYPTLGPIVAGWRVQIDAAAYLVLAVGTDGTLTCEPASN